ncbi:MAG: N-acetyl sugar amidotransferase [Kordiimonadaceae bacterium]|jgi:N-acetyl sugar amidotransferase|nr:N-acetyl sugar amidotransferase [Kordiimonadaceae bacterium]MBT6036482.1 N-acetyl sugar amidotransferase [Kordiimonadaceae bacterium]
MTEQTCKRCIYTSDFPLITFDEEGVCNYCHDHDDMCKEYPTGEEGQKRLEKLAEDVIKAGKGKPYDVIIGVSGGCDSSFMMHQAIELGLRPLAVHFDNTWNSTIATQNIRKMTEQLDIDLYTIVADNKEYDDIYKAFIKAGVPDIEAPTDIAFAAVMYKAAAKFGVKYSFNGHSFRTEGVSPLGWLYMDGKYIADVHKKYGKIPMKTYPNMTILKQFKWMIFNGVKQIRPIYYTNYIKEDVKKMLIDKYDWEWYGGHHLDNRFTAFYHRYFMPKRFGIDMRIIEQSALVRCGQLTREEAATEMAKVPYEDPVAIEIMELVKKRLGYSDNEFISLMEAPKRNYREFKNYRKLFIRLKPLLWLMYKLELAPKSFYTKYTRKDD